MGVDSKTMQQGQADLLHVTSSQAKANTGIYQGDKGGSAQVSVLRGHAKQTKSVSSDVCPCHLGGCLWLCNR